MYICTEELRQLSAIVPKPILIPTERIKMNNMRKLKSHRIAMNLWGNNIFPGIYQICIDVMCMCWRVVPIINHCIEIHPNTNQNNKNGKQQSIFLNVRKLRFHVKACEHLYMFICLDGLHQLSAIASKSILIPTKRIKINNNNHWCPAEGHAVMTYVLN